MMYDVVSKLLFLVLILALAAAAYVVVVYIGGAPSTPGALVDSDKIVAETTVTCDQVAEQAPCEMAGCAWGSGKCAPATNNPEPAKVTCDMITAQARCTGGCVWGANGACLPVVPQKAADTTWLVGDGVWYVLVPLIFVVVALIVFLMQSSMQTRYNEVVSKELAAAANNIDFIESGVVFDQRVILLQEAFNLQVLAERINPLKTAYMKHIETQTNLTKDDLLSTVDDMFKWVLTATPDQIKEKFEAAKNIRLDHDVEALLKATAIDETMKTPET